jgi:hypothetical protein
VQIGHLSPPHAYHVDIIVGVGCTIRKRGGVSPLDDDRLSQGALTAYRDGKLIDWLDELTARLFEEASALALSDQRAHGVAVARQLPPDVIAIIRRLMRIGPRNNDSIVVATGVAT